MLSAYVSNILKQANYSTYLPATISSPEGNDPVRPGTGLNLFFDNKSAPRMRDVKLPTQSHNQRPNGPHNPIVSQSVSIDMAESL